MSMPENKDAAGSSNSTVDGADGAPRYKRHETNNTHAGVIPKITKDYPATTSKMKEDLVSSMDTLHLTPSSSDENTTKKKWLRAKDSLDSLPKNPEIISSKSTSCTASKGKMYMSDSPHSESFIGSTKNTSSGSVSKVLSWDPWDKLSRKCKKENKRRKGEKLSEAVIPSTSKEKEANWKDHKSGDEAARPLFDTPSGAEATFEEYVYQPYQKTHRSVEFTNKVMVVYINQEDKVVGEASEPLKKELEQQIRNKEMRRGHMPDVTFARRNAMCEWFKK